MGSQVTLSGFNKIDFNMILEAVMQQEQAPLRSLQTQQQTLTSRNSRYATLATKLSTLESAAKDLGDASAFVGHTLSLSDSTALTASATTSARAGTYNVVVSELARSQVTASASVAPDADTTPVAMAGSLTITAGGTLVTVELTGAVTLNELASRINATPGMPVTATVIRASSTAYRLVLTSNTIGTDGRFTVTNGLTGALAFTDSSEPPDGVSGDLDGDNAVVATDAVALVNNVEVRSSNGNTIAGAIPGVTLTLSKKGASTTVFVSDDMATTKTRIKKFVDAYNDLLKFYDDQRSAAASGDDSNLSRDPLMRSLKSTLRNALTAAYGTGDIKSLSTVGIGFDTSGRLSFESTRFDDRAAAAPETIRALFGGTTGTPGAFDAIQSLVESYTKTGGLLGNVRDRVDVQLSALSRRIDDAQDRLDRRRLSLQQEYIAADMLMTRLNSDASALSSLGSSYSAF